jgi:DUF4097 and DUF4098 domain-containing protein YvlB
VDSDSNVANNDFVASEPFYFRVDVVGQEQLSLEGISGSIAITGVAGSDSVVISGEKRVRSESTEDAEEHLDLLEVSVEDLTTGVYVETVQPEQSHGRSYEVDYDIVMPDTWDVAIQNVNGQITLDDIFASASVQLVNGQVAGDVTIPLGGTMGMSVVNGAIALDIPQTTSAEFSAAVVNGTITVTGLTLEDAVSTSNSVTGTLGDGEGTIGLSVVNGTISVLGF